MSLHRRVVQCRPCFSVRGVRVRPRRQQHAQLRCLRQMGDALRRLVELERRHCQPTADARALAAARVAQEAAAAEEDGAGADEDYDAVDDDSDGATGTTDSSGFVRVQLNGLSTVRDFANQLSSSIKHTNGHIGKIDPVNDDSSNIIDFIRKAKKRDMFPMLMFNTDENICKGVFEDIYIYLDIFI